ncbi:MAG: aminopeptidase [Verrucomicrobia bacterium]|nr:aminopeptidase [Verrucomicrobiota bacterium]
MRTVICLAVSIAFPALVSTAAPPAQPAANLASASNMLAHVQMLASTIGPRNVSNYSNLVASANYIEKCLADLQYSVKTQQFESGSVLLWNLECEIGGSSSVSNEIIIVGAHYDTCYKTPGANDNASGIAVMLELARLLRTNTVDRTLRFVAFVNEEPPFFKSELMGSVVYAARSKQRGEKIVGMMSLETVGYYSEIKNSQTYPTIGFGLFYPSKGNFIAFVSNKESKALLQNCEQAFTAAGPPLPIEALSTGQLVPGISLSDQWSFWIYGYPGMMVTDTAMFRYRHYHKATDTPEKLNYEKMADLVRGLRAVIERLSRK